MLLTENLQEAETKSGDNTTTFKETDDSGSTSKFEKKDIDNSSKKESSSDSGSDDDNRTPAVPFGVKRPEKEEDVNGEKFNRKKLTLFKMIKSAEVFAAMSTSRKRLRSFERQRSDLFLTLNILTNTQKASKPASTLIPSITRYTLKSRKEKKRNEKKHRKRMCKWKKATPRTHAKKHSEKVQK